MTDVELKSYKPYARLVTILSAIVILIASLDASQVIQLFPEYANQINTILMVAGLLAPSIAQEARVVRAEDLVRAEDKENVEEELVDSLKELADEDVSEMEIVVDDGGA